MEQFKALAPHLTIMAFMCMMVIRSSLAYVRSRSEATSVAFWQMLALMALFSMLYFMLDALVVSNKLKAMEIEVLMMLARGTT